jgi:hypothetical protein
LHQHETSDHDPAQGWDWPAASFVVGGLKALCGAILNMVMGLWVFLENHAALALCAANRW